jgi:DNA-binding IclR family transcriptional regulator
MEHTPDRGRVKAVDTTLDVVQHLHQAESAGIKEVADAVDVGTSTAHRHLTTLHERGYIVRKGNEYALSLRFLTHGGRQRETLRANQLIHRKVRQLSEDTSERVQFITEEHGERVYMYTHAGADAVKTDATIGKRGPLHVSAAGKAILTNLPADRREQILNRVATPETAQWEALDEELETVRERGYAFNDEESTSGLRAVGVPVQYESDTVLGAISVSGPANRLTGEYFREELPNLLMGSVNEVELNIEYV